MADHGTEVVRACCSMRRRAMRSVWVGALREGVVMLVGLALVDFALRRRLVIGRDP